MMNSADNRLTTTAICLLLTASLTWGFKMSGMEGQPITLPCTYQVNGDSDLTTMCWGRDSCPNSRCNKPLIWTDGRQVTFRSMDRYQLNGPILKGTVSLTIESLTLQDQGTYCCRVEHAGWFNDMKLNIDLVVKKATTTTQQTTTAKTIPPPPNTTVEMSIPSTITLITDLMESLPTDISDNRTFWVTDLPTTHERSPVVPTESSTESYNSTANENASTDLYGVTSPTGNTGKMIVFTTQSLISNITQINKLNPEQPTEENSQTDEESSIISGNVTVVEKEKPGFPVYILITSLVVFAILIALLSAVVMKLRGKGSGAYFFPPVHSLELVTHAEDLANETQAEVSQVNETDGHQGDKAESIAEQPKA
ncbi:hypothetical protein GDO86_005168 [Hymenochirus boettgeri]|uniref:Ig-like domain-containing protein n=1 Tax=Hymenochirus boettgeri TaxID=247094 RepID=A0A8T2J8B9_9PIPI|nr:hypothetical protein GDO86_005168 [Hymenochirus boettgeri]